MFNSATLTAILVNILAALFFTCITICIATHFAKKKANEADKKLINNKCYGIIAVIFYNYKLYCVIHRNSCCICCRRD